MNIEKEYENFLIHLLREGYTELQFIKFLRGYYFPSPSSGSGSMVPTVAYDGPILNRDYSKYAFNGKQSLSKRKTMLQVLTFLISDKRIPVEEINNFALQNRFSSVARPLVFDVKNLPPHLLTRYFTKEEDLISAKELKYAVYNQFGGEGFDRMCTLFNNEYDLNIKKQ